MRKSLQSDAQDLQPPTRIRGLYAAHALESFRKIAFQQSPLGLPELDRRGNTLDLVAHKARLLSTQSSERQVFLVNPDQRLPHQLPISGQAIGLAMANLDFPGERYRCPGLCQAQPQFIVFTTAQLFIEKP